MGGVSLMASRPVCEVVDPCSLAAVVLQRCTAYLRQSFHPLLTLLLPFLVDQPGHDAAHRPEHKQQ